jgi:SAM-dependent methyltransferase
MHVPKELSSGPVWLSSRALPALRLMIERLPKPSRVFDLGCGRGRHTCLALMAGHDVIAVDRKPSICEALQADIAALGLDRSRFAIIQDDFINISPAAMGSADLVIVTGVLQHAQDGAELARRLEHLARLAANPTSAIYIEMLCNMLFDGSPPRDGRMTIEPEAFRHMLCEVFPRSSWRLELICGPTRQTQTFDEGGRSFEAPARSIASTAVEYVIGRVHSHNLHHWTGK